MRSRWRTAAVFGAGLCLLLLGTEAAAQKKPEKPLNINTAAVEELEQLPGVGEVIAKRIVRHREVSGKFRSVNELLVIRGISRKKLEELRPYVMVDAKGAEGTEERD